MKNPIAKLYEKLTPSELATVALKHLYHGDNDEAGRVALMVPRVHYIGNDLAYMQKVRDRSESLMSFCRVSAHGEHQFPITAGAGGAT